MCVQAKKVSDFPTNVFTFSGARALIPFQTIFVASSNFTVLCLIMIVLRRGFYYLCLKILRTFWVQWNDTEVNYFWISANSSWGSSKSHFALNFRSLYFWACQLLLVTECSIIGTVGEKACILPNNCWWYFYLIAREIIMKSRRIKFAQYLIK